jgi:hypothetical protein
MTRLLSIATASSLGLELDVVAFGDLVALDDVACIYLLAGLRIDLAILDAMAGALVDLMEADLLALGGGREERDRTRDERELEVTLPVRARRHRRTPMRNATIPRRVQFCVPRPATCVFLLFLLFVGHACLTPMGMLSVHYQ